MRRLLRGQTKPLGAPKPTQDQYAASYPAGSYTWTCPLTGFYRFAVWATGGQSSAGNGGASSGHSQTVKHIAKGAQIPIVVSTYGGGSSSVTFPDGSAVVVTSASAGTPGAASGGMINLAGSLGGVGALASGADGLGGNGGLGGTGGISTGGGAGAPGYGPFRGGDGGNDAAGVQNGQTPGGGAIASGSYPVGSGLVIIQKQSTPQIR